MRVRFSTQKLASQSCNTWLGRFVRLGGNTLFSFVVMSVIWIFWKCQFRTDLHHFILLHKSLIPALIAACVHNIDSGSIVCWHWFRVRDRCFWFPRFADCSMDVITQPSIPTTTVNWEQNRERIKAIKQAHRSEAINHIQWWNDHLFVFLAFILLRLYQMVSRSQ